VRKTDGIVQKTRLEIEKMRDSGKILASILREIQAKVAPGVSTYFLDQFAESRCRDFGVIPAFKGYHQFPGSVCVSINSEVVHGVPSQSRILQEGDIIGLDFGVIKEGWYSDSAVTVAVGKIAPEVQKLLDVTKESLMAGIEQARPGKKIGDIGFAVQNVVEKYGFSVVRDFVGHGIGKNLHEDPAVPNYGKPGQGLTLKAGMVIAIEPMVNMGKSEVAVLADHWTVATKDGSLSAHFEHTLAITETGPDILTL
jgi:methionyl aminopeptidase